MRSKIFLLCILAACEASSSLLYAGTMGAVKEQSSFVPFISGEGIYTWPQIDGFSVNLPSIVTSYPSVKNQGWGGRFAVGIMHAMTDRFAYSGELGWGYYGHTQMHAQFEGGVPPEITSVGLDAGTVNMDQWGFDILAGLLYTQPKYDLFFKAGALFQNSRIGANNIAVNDVGTTMSFNNTLPEVLPEIKLGGAYHVTEKLLATLSWMHAFGGTFGMNAPITVSASSSSLSTSLNSFQSPVINSMMFGLEYRFG